MEYKDYYKILGVERAADDKAIKTAYRKLARKYHPDVSKGSATKFQEVNEAYEVLSDPEKRRRYDTLGPDWERQAGAGAGAGGGHTRGLGGAGGDGRRRGGAHRGGAGGRGAVRDRRRPRRVLGLLPEHLRRSRPPR